jgi:hypothetical protein
MPQKRSGIFPFAPLLPTFYHKRTL